jgi:hypothetical protein
MTSPFTDMKQFVPPSDRAIDQESKIAIELTPPKDGKPMEWGRRYRETFKPTNPDFIVDIGLV